MSNCFPDNLGQNILGQRQNALFRDFWRHSWFWKAYNGLKLGQLLFSIFSTPPPICPKNFVHDCLRFSVFWNLSVYAIRPVQFISNRLFCRKCTLCSLSWCSRCSKVYLLKPLFRCGPNEISVNKPVAKMVLYFDCEHVDQLLHEKLAKNTNEKVKIVMRPQKSFLKVSKLCKESKIWASKCVFDHFHLLDIVFLPIFCHQKRKILLGQLCLTNLAWERLLRMYSASWNVRICNLKQQFRCLDIWNWPFLPCESDFSTL